MERLTDRAWHRWRPRDLRGQAATNMADIESTLRQRWQNWLLDLIIPKKEAFPTLARHIEIAGEGNAFQIFGATRWGTLRSHTTALRRAVKHDAAFIPWTDSSTIAYFNHLRDSSARPGALNGIWLPPLFVEKHRRYYIPVASTEQLQRTRDSIMENMETTDCFDERQAPAILFYEVLDLELGSWV